MICGVRARLPNGGTGRGRRRLLACEGEDSRARVSAEPRRLTEEQVALGDGQGLDQSQRGATFGARMAEAEGFEPPVPCGTSVFKTGAFSRSATPPHGECRGRSVARSAGREGEELELRSRSAHGPEIA